MQYEGEDTLQNHLPAALWEKLNTQLPKLYHLPVAPFEKMRIWALMMSMEMIAAQQGGYLSTAGVDLYLLGKAKAAKKTIISLETAQSQLSALSSTSESSQQTDLSMMLDATYLTSFYADLDALSAAWKKGDPDKMYKISLKTMQRYPNMQKQFDTLLGPRNHAFANQIADLLKKNPNKQIMVAVGAMHLAGPDSVQVHLKKLGLQAIAQPRN